MGVGVGIKVGALFKCGCEGGGVSNADWGQSKEGGLIWVGLDWELAVSNAETLQENAE